jgi:adenosylmethionine-8-amino-7-oxononanoate aminotransferase
MIEWNTKALTEADKKFVWHPFTNMRDWCAPDQEQLTAAAGAIHDSIVEVCRQ